MEYYAYVYDKCRKIIVSLLLNLVQVVIMHHAITLIHTHI